MERCNTCPQWTAPRTAEALRLEYNADHLLTLAQGGEIAPPNVALGAEVRGYGQCRHAETTHGHLPAGAAFALDDEAYHAALYTRPDFGCTEHPGNR